MKRFTRLFAVLLVASCGGGKPTTTTTTPTPATQPSAPAAEPPAPPPAEAPPPELAFPADEFRQTQPGPGPARPLQLPAPQRFTLKNGVEVYLVEDHTLPKVTASLVFKGGAVDDPVGKEGLASVCARTMGDSTQALDKVALSEAKADMASSVSVSAGDDEMSVSMAALTRVLEPTAALWADVLLRPGLRKEDLDRWVQRDLASLKQAKGSAPGVAGRLRPLVMFGARHPLGRIVTEKSLAAITIDDCKKFASDWFKPKGAKLWIAGDVTRAQVEALTAPLFKAWTGAPKKSAAIGKPAPLAKARIVFVDVPGSAQSEVAVFMPGPERKAKDYFSNTILGAVLGGSFSGRMNMNLREKNGYSYGAFGNFGYPAPKLGMLSIRSSIRTDVTDKAVREIFAELDKLVAEGITDEELGREKNALVFGLPARFETPGAVLGAFRGLAYYGLPLDYFKQFAKNVESVDKAAVARSAKAHLKPGDMVVFVVGDGEKVLPGLNQLVTDKVVGPGELVVLDADGQVVKK